MVTAEDLFFRLIITPLIFIFVVSFGIGWIIPRLWIIGEKQWWMFRLGNSTASRIIIMYIEHDFNLLIKQKEIDDASPRPLAVLQAIWIRLKEIFVNGLTKELEGLKNEKITRIVETAINNLNEGWRRGIPYPILYDYMKIIEDSAYDSAIGNELRMRGLCAVAVVKYALGNIKEGHDLGKINWKEANKADQKTELLWMAAYGFIYSKMFLGAEDAMRLMADQWNGYYASEGEETKEKMKQLLNDRLILNPILSIPRHIILAGTFKEPTKLDRIYFPSTEAYQAYKSNETKNKIENEIQWVNLWHQEAVKICEKKYDEQGISLDFSHAYTGFYYTLLLQEAEEQDLILDLRERIKTIFDKIDESAPIPARYAKYGFQGIYDLVRGRDEEALDSLRKAATFSSISGNRFADCIFMCCLSVAAARLCMHQRRCLAPELNYYLREARKLADKISGNFYPALYSAAYSSVCKIQGNEGEAKRYLLRSKQGSVGLRILKIFQNGDLAKI